MQTRSSYARLSLLQTQHDCEHSVVGEYNSRAAFSEGKDSDHCQLQLIAGIADHAAVCPVHVAADACFTHVCTDVMTGSNRAASDGVGVVAQSLGSLEVEMVACDRVQSGAEAAVHC